jgi:signal transduction histidine kinase
MCGRSWSRCSGSGVLIDNVLDLTQSDTGSLLLAEDRVDLHAMCTEAAEEKRRLGEHKGIEFAVEVDQSVGTITGDRRRLRQALGNILDNAFAYTRRAGACFSTRRVRLGGEHHRLRQRRRDRPSDQTRVFDRFHRSMVAGRGGTKRSASASRSPSSSSRRIAARSSFSPKWASAPP